MVGIGYDIHRLVENRTLYLGGVKIDFSKGLAGHSDGDVLIHAVCDALLGAANLGDIGLHFPPDDEKYKGISSIELLKHVRTFLERSNFIPRNIDAVVITEEPKILTYVKSMRENIANALHIPAEIISIKGKTNEGLGDIGRGNAIAAWAVCEVGRIYAPPER
ncbi:MAG: 2-C-methyl-D-erythritol 2,4-cyclodiphosphate synthase [candidate division WOR-3 bacterium]|nr:MAG: 2-C-methyl-D-erythritol 2,4-cyclodiphosphate synthase [candidate division WOR-3 bacterium]